jgi:hypothetical protein
VASALASALTSVAAPASAATVCEYEAIPAPVAAGAGICIGYPEGVNAPPSLEVTTTPARLVQLVHPDGGGEDVTVSVTLELEGDVRTVEIPIPMDGGKTCLFFQGREIYKPDGCVLAIHGEAPQVDELFEVLPVP